MAIVTLLGTPTFNTNTGTKTVTATPSVGSLILIITAHSTNTSAATATDDNSSGVYTTVKTALKAASADTMMIQIRTTPITASVSTIFTHAPGTSSGGGLAIYQITGMNKAGASASLQVGGDNNVTSTGTPAPVFGSTPQLKNPVIGAVFSSATTVPRTNYTEDFDGSYISPAADLELMHLTANEGETSATITWGGSATQPFCTAIIELDFTLPMQTKNYQFVKVGDGMSTSEKIR